MRSDSFFSRLFSVCGLILLLCGAARAQELSGDFYAYQQRIVRCRDNANSTRASFDSLEQACAALSRSHPEEAARARLILGELYKDAANVGLRDSRTSQRHYRAACATAARDDHFTRSKALYCQGLLYYYNRPDLEQDFDSAYYYFSQAARYDDLYLVGLGVLLQYGLGVRQDEKAALANFAAAIAGGSDCYADFYATEYALRARSDNSLNTEAYNDYRKYFVENNLNGNWPSALSYLRKSAEAGYPPALLDLSIHYMSGKIQASRAEIIENAENLLQRAVKAKYVPAIYQYGYLQQCLLTSSDDKRAKTMFDYYKRSAEAGHAPGQCATGVCYLKGYGTRQDLEKAGEWITAAVNQGYKRAIDMQDQVLLEIQRIKGEKMAARQERLRKWAAAMQIIAGVADAASQALTLNTPSAPQHFTNSSEVMRGTSSQAAAAAPISAAQEVSIGYHTVLKIGDGFGEVWTDNKGTMEICENSRTKMKSIKLGGKYYTLSENHKSEFLGVPVSRYNYFTIIGNVYYYVSL